MKWRKLLKPLLVVVLIWWWGLLIQSPPSTGLWRDVRCDLVYDEVLGYKMPRNCVSVYRLYPDLGAWLYEFFVEPVSLVRQGW